MRGEPGTVHLLALLVCLLGLAGCDKLDVQPGPFSFPLELTVSREESLAHLSWSQASVSTFQEYLILRSTEVIPDDPEPVSGGNTILVTRIDQRTVTSFTDSNLPLTDTLYYKVYARIDGRFLMTPTVKMVQDLHLLPVRTDIAEYVPSKHSIILFDRTTRQMHIYDYLSREFLRSKNMQSFNFPNIRYSEADDEILLAENGTHQFVDYNSLALKQSFSSGTTVRTVRYSNGWIYEQRGDFPYGFRLYRRSDLSLRDELTVLQTDWRNFSVYPDPTDGSKATIYDFSFSGSARYVQNGSNLDLDLQNNEFLTGSQVTATANPVRPEFVATNAGQIINGNLQLIKTLENGSANFNMFTYTPDGKKLCGISFVNNAQLRIYDADDDYKLLKTFDLSNQVSIIGMFADESNVNVIGLAFVNPGTQTLIYSFAY